MSERESLIAFARQAEIVQPDDRSITKFAPFVSVTPETRDALVEAVEALDGLIRLDRGLEYIQAHPDTGNAEMIVKLDAFDRCVHALETLGVT